MCDYSPDIVFKDIITCINKSLLRKKNNLQQQGSTNILNRGFMIIRWIPLFMDFVIKLIHDKMLIKVHF